MTPISGQLGDVSTYEFCPSKVDDPESVRGTLCFTPAVSPDHVEYPEFVEVSDEDWDDGQLQIVVTAGEKTRGSIRIRIDGEKSFLRMLSAPAYFAVEQTLRGNVGEALSVIQRTYSRRWAWEFRNNCRDTLSFEAFADVLDALTSESTDFSHTQFRSGIGYFAKRIGDTIPQGIYSFNELQQRIRYWNATENLITVSVPEVVGEKLGRDWYRSEFGSERDELRRIGFDPLEYDPEWQTVVPACWIAHLILTEGIAAARTYVRNRPATDARSYDELKAEARNANQDSGVAWGAVVAQTLGQPNDDLRFDTFNYLNQTSEEYRGKAKFQPFLYAAALEIAPDHMPPHVLQNVEFNRELSTGHNWRRDGAWQRAQKAFAAAKEIARGSTNDEYQFNAFLFVEAEASLAHATAQLRSPTEATEMYQAGIRSIQRVNNNFEVPDWKVKDDIGFLREQSNEIS